MTMQGSNVPFRMGGTLAPTTVIGAGNTNSEEISCLSKASLRLRVKVSAAATLKAFALLTDGSTSSASGNPADVPLVANTEVVMEIPLKGEGAYRISILAGGAPSTVTYVDVYPA